jgi:predicted Zn-dependent protease
MSLQDRLAQLQQLLAETPNDHFLEYGIALEIAKTNLQEGIAKLKNLTEKHPTYLPSYYRLGSFLADTGQEKEAVAYVQQGLHLAKVQKDAFTAKELQALLEELTFE